MKCTLCKENIVDGVIRAGNVYCSEEHAQEDWVKEKADRFAYNESGGRYYNFEDYIEHEHGIKSYSENDNYIFDRGF